MAIKKMTDGEITNYFDTLDQIDEIEDQENLFKIIVSVTPNLAPEYIKKALKAVKKIKNLSEWNEALIAIAPCFTSDFFEELFKEILTTPVHSKNRGSTLINLTPHIPLGLFKNALQISGEINKSNITNGVLDGIAPRIENSSLFLEVLKIAIEKSHPKTLIILNSRLQEYPNLLPEVEVLKLAEDFLANKNYYACAQILATSIPYLSSNLLAQVLDIARRIDDAEAKKSLVNKLTVLDYKISENYSNAANNNLLYADWYEDIDDWKRLVAEKFTEYTESIKVWKTSNHSYIYETNLAVWRAIGNEVLDENLCAAPRSKAKILALLYYYFKGEQQAQIFDELLETIEEIPAKSCKARSYIKLIPYLPSSASLEIIKRAISIVKEIYEDIIKNDLRDSKIVSDNYFQPQELYTKIENSYTKLKELEIQLDTSPFLDLKSKILELIETTDSLLFPYPGWWKPNMIEFLPPSLGVEIPVFFATDRQHSDTKSVKFYSGKRYLPSEDNKDNLEYGIAKVSIPKNHRMGEIERPSWLKFEFREDLFKHFVLMNIDVFDCNSFVNTLRKSVANSVANEKSSNLLLFIHGYNTSFEDAAIRTAQIAYDLQFTGQTILYSWPSEAKLESYPSDANNIDWTLPHFEKFLNLLLTSVGADIVNTIAHSMGNRIMVRALDKLDRSNLPENAAKLRNVIFAAPDIDAATFKQFIENYQQKEEKAGRLTLYASSNDKALKASMSFNGKHPRAGSAGADIIIVDGLDTIDASNVDTSFMGHSYFGDDRSVISDIFCLIKHNFSPIDRPGLISKNINNLDFWSFRA